MKIPRLSSAFGCFTLRTSMKIIAVLELVIQLIIFMSFLIFTSNVSRYDHTFPANIVAKCGPAFVIVVGTVILLFLLFLPTFLMIIGALKGMPGLMKFWMKVRVLILVFLGSFGLTGVVYFLFAANLYFLWVVYSHYKQLCDDGNASAQPAARDIEQAASPLAMPSCPPAYYFDGK